MEYLQNAPSLGASLGSEAFLSNYYASNGDLSRTFGDQEYSNRQSFYRVVWFGRRWLVLIWGEAESGVWGCNSSLINEITLLGNCRWLIWVRCLCRAYFWSAEVGGRHEHRKTFKGVWTRGKDLWAGTNCMRKCIFVFSVRKICETCDNLNMKFFWGWYP